MSLNTSLQHLRRALSTGTKYGRHFGLVDRERMNSDAAAGDANVTVRSTQKGSCLPERHDNGTRKLIESHTTIEHRFHIFIRRMIVCAQMTLKRSRLLKPLSTFSRTMSMSDCRNAVHSLMSK